MFLPLRKIALYVLVALVVIVSALIVRAQDSDNDGMPDAYELLFGLDPTNANDAVVDNDQDGLTNVTESALWTDPWVADTDRDGFSDATDSNALSRAWLAWGARDYTDGDIYDYTGPAWWLGAWQGGGTWLTNEPYGWYVSATTEQAVGSLTIDTDRALLSNDLVMALDFYDHTGSVFHIALSDTNGMDTVSNLFGNVADGTAQSVTKYLRLPMASNPAALIRIYRDEGAVSVYRTQLYIDDDGDGLDKEQEAQLGTSDQSTDSDQDGLLDKDEVFTHHTNPALVDSDGDGMDDATELLNGHNPSQYDYYTALPFIEDFETNTVTLGPVNDQNGWVGSALAQVVTSPVYEGQQALLLGSASNLTQSVTLSHEFAQPAHQVVWVDGMMQLQPAAQPDIGSDSASFYVNTFGQPVVYNGDHWQTLTNTSLSLGEWTRVTLKLDYAARQWDLLLDGIEIAEGLGIAGDMPAFSKVQVDANFTVMDQFSVDGRIPDKITLDGDTLPDRWEEDYFTNLNQTETGDPDQDALNNRQEYDLGTNPNNSDTDGDGINDGAELKNGWNPTQSNTYAALPFVEDFETNTVTLGPLNGQHGWVATELAQVVTNPVYAGQQALQLGYATNINPVTVGQGFMQATSSVLWVDMQLQVVPSQAADHNTNDAAAVYFNESGRLMADVGGQWQELNHTPLTTGSWARITLKLDYTAQQYDVLLNSIRITNALAFAAPASALSAMYLEACYGAADQLCITPVKPIGLSMDGDVLSDEWEQAVVDFNTNDPYTTIEDIQPEDDFDGDGYSNLEEYQNHTDATRTTVFDQGMYDTLYTNQLSGLDALLQNYEHFLPDLQALRGMTPNGDTLTIKQGFGEWAFDIEGFDADFLNGLVPVVVSNVVTYPVYIYDDPVTGERVVMNANNEAIAVLPGLNSMMGRMAGEFMNLLGESGTSDPSNAEAVVGFNLVLPEDVAQLVWDRANLPSYQAAELLVTNKCRIVKIQQVDDQVELTLKFAATNTMEIFECDNSQGETPRIWHSVTIIPKPTESSQLVWTDPQPCAINELRVYAMADADQDSDGDGFSDGREILVYLTDPAEDDSYPWTLSGKLFYFGSQTADVVRVTVKVTGNGWERTVTANANANGEFNVTGLPPGQSFEVKASADSNGNGQHESWEPAGSCTKSSSEQNVNLELSLFDPDTDNDTLPDWWEQKYFSGLSEGAGGDQDNDGLTNTDENRYGSDPKSDDSDGDGAKDNAEVSQGSCPSDASDEGSAVNCVTVELGAGDTMGGCSEQYALQIGPARYVSPMGGYGSSSYAFVKGKAYDVTLEHLGSNGAVDQNDPPQGSPDYDFIVKLDNVPRAESGLLYQAGNWYSVQNLYNSFGGPFFWGTQNEDNGTKAASEAYRHSLSWTRGFCLYVPKVKVQNKTIYAQYSVPTNIYLAAESYLGQLPLSGVFWLDMCTIHSGGLLQNVDLNGTLTYNEEFTGMHTLKVQHAITPNANDTCIVHVLRVDIEQGSVQDPVTFCLGNVNYVDLNLTAEGVFSGSSYLGPDGSAEWTVTGGDGGHIQGSGRSVRFTASEPGTYYVTAKSSIMPSCSDTCKVIVTPPEVYISQGDEVILADQQETVLDLVEGVNMCVGPVTWSCEPNEGITFNVSEDGKSVTLGAAGPGVYTVTARSVNSPTTFDTCKVIIVKMEFLDDETTDYNFSPSLGETGKFKIKISPTPPEGGFEDLAFNLYMVREMEAGLGPEYDQRVEWIKVGNAENEYRRQPLNFGTESFEWDGIPQAVNLGFGNIATVGRSDPFYGLSSTEHAHRYLPPITQDQPVPPPICTAVAKVYRLSTGEKICEARKQVFIPQVVLLMYDDDAVSMLRDELKANDGTVLYNSISSSEWTSMKAQIKGYLEGFYATTEANIRIVDTTDGLSYPYTIARMKIGGDYWAINQLGFNGNCDYPNINPEGDCYWAFVWQLRCAIFNDYTTWTPPQPALPLGGGNLAKSLAITLCHETAHSLGLVYSNTILDGTSGYKHNSGDPPPGVCWHIDGNGDSIKNMLYLDSNWQWKDINIAYLKFILPKE